MILKQNSTDIKMLECVYLQMKQLADNDTF